VTRLVLIRHGEAQAFLDSVVAGEKGCRGLSDLGRQQTEKLRERLARTGELADASVLYASVLPRAIETGEIVAPAVGELPVKPDCDLCELHPGECDGMPWEEFQSTYGADEWDPEREMSPGGESWVSFVQRVDGALHRLVRTHPDETVVIACHGGIVMSSLLIGFDLSPIGRWLEPPQNTSLTEWLIEDGRWQLIRYNDAAHLSLG
jgi:probable phosphoglycerate mutase